MNLYFRLVWTLLRCWLGKPIHSDQTLVVRRRVLLNDLDINLHLNNGRYLTLLDLAILEFFARSQFLAPMLRKKWRPMAGGAVITFRRQLSALQAYDLHFRWSCSDDRWNYMTFEFIADGQLCAAGIMKGGLVGKDGLVATDQYVTQLSGERRAAVQTLMDRELTPAVQEWRLTENNIHQSARNRHLSRPA
ncbi:MAG: thioesterase family protein [Burkholderiaceae bacterium]